MGISHHSCFNPPPLISQVAQIKDRPSFPSDETPCCGALRRSKKHKAHCLPGLCKPAGPCPGYSASLFHGRN